MIITKLIKSKKLEDLGFKRCEYKDFTDDGCRFTGWCYKDQLFLTQCYSRGWCYISIRDDSYCAENKIPYNYYYDNYKDEVYYELNKFNGISDAFEIEDLIKTCELALTILNEAKIGWNERDIPDYKIKALKDKIISACERADKAIEKAKAEDIFEKYSEAGVRELYLRVTSVKRDKSYIEYVYERVSKNEMSKEDLYKWTEKKSDLSFAWYIEQLEELINNKGPARYYEN